MKHQNSSQLSLLKISHQAYHLTPPSSLVLFEIYLLSKIMSKKRMGLCLRSRPHFTANVILLVFFISSFIFPSTGLHISLLFYFLYFSDEGDSDTSFSENEMCMSTRIRFSLEPTFSFKKNVLEADSVKCNWMLSKVQMQR